MGMVWDSLVLHVFSYYELYVEQPRRAIHKLTLNETCVTHLHMSTMGWEWGGNRAVIRASLRFAALRCAALRCASLRFAALRCATLRCASLRFAALRCASLRFAALRCAATSEHGDCTKVHMAHARVNMTHTMIMIGNAYETYTTDSAHTRNMKTQLTNTNAIKCENWEEARLGRPLNSERPNSLPPGQHTFFRR